MYLTLLTEILIINLLIINIISAPMDQNEGMEYLNKFGYGTNKTETAIKKFQENFQLPETGMLDAATLAQMDQPRCGRPDGVEIQTEHDIWPKSPLSYTVKNGPFSGQLNTQDVDAELREAFKMWAEQIPLNFEKNDHFGDIDVRFINPREKGKSDGRGRTLAYAYYPDVGDIYFDAENWTQNSSIGYNFRIVAAHEIGHSLGLGHSKNKKSLMYPIYRPYRPGWALHESDISNIKKLYSFDHLCQFGYIDGLFHHNEHSIILVKGRYCWKFQNNKLSTGWPKKCQNIWSKFPENFDAVFKDGNNLNFFLENRLFSFENGRKNFNFGKIEKIDTVLVIENRMYVFEGPNYWTFLKKNLSWVKKGDLQKIEDFWKGVPAHLDAAIFDLKNNVFFFKNSEVYRFNIDSKKIEKTIPMNEYFQC